MMKILDKTSPGVIAIICVIFCSVISAASNSCPEDQKLNCITLASLLNCALCLYVSYRIGQKVF